MKKQIIVILAVLPFLVFAGCSSDKEAQEVALQPEDGVLYEVDASSEGSRQTPDISEIKSKPPEEVKKSLKDKTSDCNGPCPKAKRPTGDMKLTVTASVDSRKDLAREIRSNSSLKKALVKNGECYGEAASKVGPRQNSPEFTWALEMLLLIDAHGMVYREEKSSLDQAASTLDKAQAKVKNPILKKGLQSKKKTLYTGKSVPEIDFCKLALRVNKSDMANAEKLANDALGKNMAKWWVNYWYPTASDSSRAGSYFDVSTGSKKLREKYKQVSLSGAYSLLNKGIESSCPKCSEVWLYE